MKKEIWERREKGREKQEQKRGHGKEEKTETKKLIETSKVGTFDLRICIRVLV